MEKVKNYSLCAGRHEIPNVEGSVFENSLDPTDVRGIEEKAQEFMRAITDDNVGLVNLYVTGLTVALVAVIKAAKNADIDLVLWHYDRERNGYYAQYI